MPDAVRDEVLLPEHLVHQQTEVENLVVVDGDEDDAVLGEEVAGEGDALPHELEPAGVAPLVVGVDEAVVVNEVAVAGVVGRVDVDAVDAAGVGHAQVAEGVEVVALDDEVGKGAVAVVEFVVRFEDAKSSWAAESGPMTAGSRSQTRPRRRSSRD